MILLSVSRKHELLILASCWVPTRLLLYCPYCLWKLTLHLEINGYFPWYPSDMIELHREWDVTEIEYKNNSDDILSFTCYTWSVIYFTRLIRFTLKKVECLVIHSVIHILLRTKTLYNNPAYFKLKHKIFMVKAYSVFINIINTDNIVKH